MELLAIDLIKYPIEAIIGIGNICIIIGLLTVYWRNYTHFKTEFSLGLLLFAFFILIDNLLFVVTFILYHNYFGQGIHNYLMLIVYLFEFIGLTTLLIVTVKK